ncbi:MAG: TlpA family protein disulfide reductase [Clostridia bacterium]|nr:TlpA family protein disulfide reductase [Clostridia bacterium]
MRNFKKTTALLLALLMAACVLLTGCQTPGTGDEDTTAGTQDTEQTTGGEQTTQTPGSDTAEKKTYTVDVKSIGGMALEGIMVKVYTDSTMADLVDFGVTDAEGKVALELTEKEGYVAELTGLPAGYEAEPYYEFVGGAVSAYVVSRVISDTNISGVSYKVGDVIRDFTVVDSDGTSHTLSEILKEKELVVLNFWYTTCSWCVEEFPYMEAAYQNYGDKVEILAFDPYGTDSESAIADFKASMGLSFPMIKDYNALYAAFGVAAFPTSVFVDRYGVICLIEEGALIGDQPFTVAFDHFTGDDYVQGLYTSVESLVPEVEINVSMPESSEIEAAINGEGFHATYRPEESEEYKDLTWPFVLGEKDGYACIRPANTGVANSYSIIYMDVELKAGEAVCFDYFTSTETYSDVLYVIVEGEDTYSLSGPGTGWGTCYPYVATKDGTYEVALTYVKDGDTDVGEDTVYVRNMRVVDMENITSPTYIPRYAATDRAEDGFGYNTYVDVVFNEADGYYHVGTVDGPLLLADLMGYTQFSQQSVFDMAYNELVGDNFYDRAVDYFSYASNSQLAGICTVNAELAELLREVAAAVGAEGHDKEWLQMCLYYDAYGVEGQLIDPIQGLAPFCAYPAELGENSFTYNRVIMPRGLLAEFIPATSGVYRITSFADQQVDGWLFDQNRNELLVYEHCERMYTDLGNVSIVFFMEAGTPYYIDIAYWDVYGTGTIPYTIEFVGESYEYFRSCAPGYFTYFENENDQVTNEIVGLGIDVALGEDGYYHELRADGSLGSIIYADFTSVSAIFSHSVLEMINMNAFNFKYSEGDLLIMSYMERYPDNTKEKLQEIWGDAFEEYAEEYKLDEVLAGTYHGMGDDMTELAKKYAGMILPASEEAPELEGCVAVDAELAELLQLLMDKYTFEGVDHSWTKLCFYYQHLGA